MRIDLVSMLLGFGIGYLALTEEGKKQLIKISNVGGEVMNSVAEKYISKPINSFLEVNKDVDEKVPDGDGKEG